MTQPRVAAVGDLAAAREDHVVLGLAGDLRGAVELALPEVAGRQPTGLVDDVLKDVGAVGGQALPGDRMLLQGLGELPRRVAEGVLVSGLSHGRLGVVAHDRLEALGTHDRAQPTAARVASGPKLRVGAGDRRRGEAPLPCHPDRNVAHLLIPVLRHELRDRVVVAQALEFRALDERHTAIGHEDHLFSQQIGAGPSIPRSVERHTCASTVGNRRGRDSSTISSWQMMKLIGKRAKARKTRRLISANSAMTGSNLSSRQHCMNSPTEGKERPHESRIVE